MAERRRTRLVVREVSGAGDPGLDGAYRLLRRTFPAHELVPRRDLVQTLRERSSGLWTDLNWHLLVAQRGGSVIGAASGWYVGSLNVGMIGYVVVRAGLRSGGLGARLRRRLRQAFETDARRWHAMELEALVGEVEAANPWLRFLITRRGAIALDVEYAQPSLYAGDRPTPLVLYWQPLNRSRRTLPASLVRRLLYAVWRRVYRIARPLESAVFRRMVRSLEGRRRIGMRELPPPRRR